MSAVVHHGDCRAVMAAMAERGETVHACVTDPPYHLTSIVKRFGSDTAAPVRVPKHGTGGFARASRGFMGKTWDGGDVAFRPETWRAVFDVLPPGGHLVVFGGTRTHHRVWCAVEDAGFEVRDTIAWLYGSGFPKSHDVSKGIDKMLGAEREVLAEGAPVKRMIPGADQHATGSWVKDNGRVFVPTVTAAGSPEAAAWEGWGTALKPAMELVCLARKPLAGTVAANVLAHGTGALNVDACRVGFASEQDAALAFPGGRLTSHGSGSLAGPGVAQDAQRSGFHSERSALGRWPANVLHDGSPDVLQAFAAFGEAPGQQAPVRPNSGTGQKTKGILGTFATNSDCSPRNDSGTASRFFYCAKATAADRAGSKHPTVKPIALMRWLVRLVTPPGGIVLDPFAGTGTTGEAALREGFRAVLIEREAEYVADINRRIARMRGGDTPLLKSATP